LKVKELSGRFASVRGRRADRRGIERREGGLLTEGKGGKEGKSEGRRGKNVPVPMKSDGQLVNQSRLDVRKLGDLLSEGFKGVQEPKGKRRERGKRDEFWEGGGEEG